MLLRSVCRLSTPKFTLDIANPAQSIADANDELDRYSKMERTGTVKWCYALLNRSMAYCCAKEFDKAREDAIDAHIAIQDRCGPRSSNLYFSARIVSQVCAAFAAEIEQLEKSEHITVELSTLLPRSIPAIYRKKGMSIGKYLREEEKEYAKFARYIMQLPGHAHMTGGRDEAKHSGWAEGNSEEEHW